jgi:hypothetical protein
MELYSQIYYFEINEWTKLARVFVPGRFFQSNVVFAGKVRSLPREEPLNSAPFCWAAASITDITQGWKGLQGTHTQVYLGHL